MYRMELQWWKKKKKNVNVDVEDEEMEEPSFIEGKGEEEGDPEAQLSGITNSA